MDTDSRRTSASWRTPTNTVDVEGHRVAALLHRDDAGAQKPAPRPAASKAEESLPPLDQALARLRDDSRNKVPLPGRTGGQASGLLRSLRRGRRARRRWEADLAAPGRWGSRTSVAREPPGGLPAAPGRWVNASRLARNQARPVACRPRSRLPSLADQQRIQRRPEPAPAGVLLFAARHAVRRRPNESRPRRPAMPAQAACSTGSNDSGLGRPLGPPPLDAFAAHSRVDSFDGAEHAGPAGPVAGSSA